MGPTLFRAAKQNPPLEPPIRAELFSVERLEQHAESLATAQRVAEQPERGRPIAKRLYENAQLLTDTYRVLLRANSERQPITPAAEWLLDNFHIFDEQVREIKDDLPPGFYRKLPKLIDGPLTGFPRVYGIAWAIVAHTDSGFDAPKLQRFVDAYQRVQKLTIGELWALAITLRIVLVENLRRLAETIAFQQAASEQANRLADQIFGTPTAPPETTATVLHRLAQIPWSTAFAVELTKRLRDYDPKFTPALHWLNEKLAAEGTTTEQIVREEFHRQTATDVTVRNVINGMRLVSMINWPEFVESVSAVDAVLRAAFDFALMDFQTRDLYRRAIEDLSRQSGRTETDVAERAVAAARAAAARGGALVKHERDPGYHLIARGRRAFEKSLGARIPFGAKLIHINSAVGVMTYVGMVSGVTAILIAIALYAAARFGAIHWELAVLAFTGVVPASDVAMAIVNRAITQRVSGRLLAALELRHGVPADLRTMVVVPTLLSKPVGIQKQIEALEVHYLSNPDDNLIFALLSDWRDSPTEHADDDDALLQAAIIGVEGLNHRYGAANGCTRFVLLHRRRLWNPSEGKWIGWERKRGKLHELNRLLRGATDTSFLEIDHALLPTNIRYVITLDSDTRLPIGTARRLIGKMAHPLNQPIYDHAAGMVVRGHGMLQPRVTPSLPIGSSGSMYQRIFSGPNGLDPYALAVSDVYQDLYDEGSYTGKGIYHIDSFEQALEDRIPENAVLSHDLLEGIYARAGLASDIEVVEEFPSHYAVSSARQHRWVRGDWQLLPWIFGYRDRTPKGGRNAAIPLIGRWKLLDNLRRSLVAPSTLLAFIAGWMLPYRIAQIWTLFVLFTIIAPPLLPVLMGLMPRRAGVTFANHARSLGRDLALGLMQSAFLITFLAHQAWNMVDAVWRTLFRLFIRRRHMLQWVTTAQHEEEAFDHRSLGMQIAVSMASALVLGAALYVAHRHTGRIAAPFMILWMGSPLAAFLASRPARSDRHLVVSYADALALRMVARRTWRFFESFITAEDNMLPPDNFQEDPNPIVARRTSPTNIGLYLLTVVAARDFGWIGIIELMDRLEKTLASIGKLETFRGHLYNWYDTGDLRPLEPKYISSVDSGNLSGHLIALANACREIIAGPVYHAGWAVGLCDTIAILREELVEREAARSALAPMIDKIADLLAQSPAAPLALHRHLSELERFVIELVDAAAGQDAKISYWVRAVEASIAAQRADFDLLMPWARAINMDQSPPELAPLTDGTLPLADLPRHCAVISAAEPAQGQLIDQSADAAGTVIARLSAIADLAMKMFEATDFGFLFDPGRQLLSIGYRVAEGNLDENFYDLLASEARLASFVGIAKGDLPAKHWFRLGRTLTPIDGKSALMSWSGSMFEYLMPSLVMRAPAGSLLEQTNTLVVGRQISYGEELDVPWGISESEYNARDIEQTYQYSSFGVPGLGYKRGLGESTVIAPYASGLAAMVAPDAAAKNFERLRRIGARGDYGWYEALDYTRARLPKGKKVAIIRAYMAHHQAMLITGIANALHDGKMRARFHSQPIIRAAELLLQERMPHDIAVANPAPEEGISKAANSPLIPDVQRNFSSPHSHLPRTHLLSNGDYSTMITATGSGYSRWRDIAIIRWREDPTTDHWGSFIYLRDTRSGATWSAGFAPRAVEPEIYEACFSEDRAQISRSDGNISTVLEIIVSPEDDAEVRRLSITNHGDERSIEVTSFAELALARPADDRAHPAFAKLFVQTEYVPELGALLATRRQRSASDPLVWAAHLAVVEGEGSGDVQFETDRAKFLGRGQTARTPAAIFDGWPLSNTTGTVLDPIFSLRRHIRIPRGGTVRIAFWTMAASTRDEVLNLADRHHDPVAFDRAKTLAWGQAQMELRYLGIASDEAHLFQRLANQILYPDPSLRPPSDVIKQGIAKASNLWPQRISGDLPIVLVRIEDESQLGLVRQLLRAHEYWRLKQLAVDLVIVNEHAASYLQDLQNALDALVRMNRSMPRIGEIDPQGSVFVLTATYVPAEIQSLLQACARVVLYGNRGALPDQMKRVRDHIPVASAAPPRPRAIAGHTAPAARPAQEYANGLGGFVDGGREYLTVLEGNERTPAPWLNVVSNPGFGFQVSTEGSGFTWAENSQQNQITPWSNDPVRDPPGEVIYLRDDESGEIWTPTALPIRQSGASYSARHGQGYSRFEHSSHGISSDLVQFVPIADPIKISRLKLVNLTGRTRKISIAAYVEWVLGANRGGSAPVIVTEIDQQTGAIFARNPWNDVFGGRVAFVDLAGKQTSYTCDRTEFIGRDGTLDRPHGMTPGTQFSNRTGAALDPCGALQTTILLPPNGSAEIVCFLGQSATAADAQALLIKYRAEDLTRTLAMVTGQWDEILGGVQVKTPDRALDILINRWVLYQVLVCRIWARSAFYQAGGAYGFRDQLQDVMALCVAKPSLAREHILRAAGRQFAEGDVQHWWMPESGRGIRTRVSDDRGWLPYVTAQYISITGDAAILDEQVPYLEGPVLKEGEHDAFFLPGTSAKTARLFEHCALALDKSLETGAHGLPLIGTGDWNDGLDAVGEGGRGESIWLGWFLCSALTEFAALAAQHGEMSRAAGWRENAASFASALERDGWDGDWYRRAYFDDGWQLGSVNNNECRIDAIAQSWAVISGAADPARAGRAMAAVDKYLVRRDDQLVLLFTPPFEQPSHNPGYIKGYPGGVRENGGQYTHAAVWSALAFAMQGDGDRAGELLAMLNPINHADTPAKMQRYKVEPYAVCADVYSEPPHVGRGGWTWYTGSAGWLYRVTLERLLGFRLRGTGLLLDPCIPRSWPGFEISFKYHSARYEIAVTNPNRVCRGIETISLDGRMLDKTALVPLADDGAVHHLQVVLGA